MSHVVTSYQWAWRYGSEVDEIMAWIGEMSEKGWELKGLTSALATRTVSPGFNEQYESVRAFMQRPVQTADALQPWNYPG